MFAAESRQPLAMRGQVERLFLIAAGRVEICSRSSVRMIAIRAASAVFEMPARRWSRRASLRVLCRWLRRRKKCEQGPGRLTRRRL